MRICIIGDELITPMGDPRGLGWVGRVLARSEFPSPPTVMTLAVPGETTSQLAARWEDEVVYRFAPDEPCALIIAVGCSDIPAASACRGAILCGEGTFTVVPTGV